MVASFRECYVRISKIILGNVAFTALSFFLNTAAQAADNAFLQAVQNPLLVQTLYADQHRILSKVAPDGAISVNADWENHTGDSYYIEQQRYGGDLIQAGIANNNDGQVQEGMKILNWGFAQEAPDGSFPGTGDPFHSTSFFLEASARATLLLKMSDPVKYADFIAAASPKIATTAHWMMLPDVKSTGQKHSQPYTHRRWIMAAAMAEAGALLHDNLLLAEAEGYARAGAALQQSDGVDPEKGGYDVSYQVVGLMMASRYYFADTNDERALAVPVIANGLNWFKTKMQPDGEVDIAGSTRVGIESGRSGKPKTLDKPAILQSLVYGAIITHDASYENYARRFAEQIGWLR